jgi:Fe/S biogenesis protein NfuA
MLSMSPEVRTGTAPDADDTVEHDPVVTLSEAALDKVLRLRAEEDDPETLGLRLEVSGLTSLGTDYTYDMYFEVLDELGPDDVVHHQGGLPVVVAERDVKKLQGSVLDVPSNPIQGGLTLRNPNKPNPLAGGSAGGDVELTGELAEQVQQVLDQRINPAIAAHGGMAQLVAVEDGTAYVRLGGGCQGCGMATVTVSQGIEAAITGAIPEIIRVVDVTDHASGTNPYFEAAAK